MKSLKKNIFIILFLLIGVFFFNADRVEADINWKGVQIECIYSDGGSYTFSYIQTGETNGTPTYKSNVNRTTYNLVGTSNMESATSSSNSYVNNPVNTSTHECKTHLRVGSAIVDEDDDTTKTYYKFGSSSSDTEFENSDVEDDSVGFWAALFSSGREASDIADDANKSANKYTLVSERYILTSNAGEAEYTLTYKSSSDQAAGSDSYAYIMVYNDGGNNIYLLKTKDRTTLLDGDTSHFDGISVNSSGEVVGIEDEDEIFINSPEPTTTTDSTGVAAYSFNYNQVRYEVSTSKSTTFSRRYVLFNTGLGSEDVPDSELCESIMKETSVVLKKIISYIQLLVPVFMIVLCGIDIGKIVISGNLEEDLPKQKKKVISRLIVGVAVFFLPLIVSLVIDLLQDSGLVEAESIKEISCLFE